MYSIPSFEHCWISLSAGKSNLAIETSECTLGFQHALGVSNIFELCSHYVLSLCSNRIAKKKHAPPSNGFGAVSVMPKVPAKPSKLKWNRAAVDRALCAIYSL